MTRPGPARPGPARPGPTRPGPAGRFSPIEMADLGRSNLDRRWGAQPSPDCENTHTFRTQKHIMDMKTHSFRTRNTAPAEKTQIFVPTVTHSSTLQPSAEHENTKSHLFLTGCEEQHFPIPSLPSEKSEIHSMGSVENLGNGDDTVYRFAAPHGLTSPMYLSFFCFKMVVDDGFSLLLFLFLLLNGRG